jgi:Tfp pilus assembly protein PilF
MKATIPFALVLALAACADDPAARIARAEKAFAAHDYRAAQIDLAAALQAEPANPAALELAARNHLAQGDGVAAQSALDKLEAMGRSPADLPLLAGEAALLRGRGEEALAVVAGIDAAEAHRIRALARLALGDAAAADKDFAAGMTAGGDRTRLLADYGRFKLRQGDLPGAAELAAKAAAAGPSPSCACA